MEKQLMKLANEAKERIEEISKKVKEKKSFKYIDRFGNHYTQDPGCFNPDIPVFMASDMLCASACFIKDEEMRSMAFKWPERMRDLGYTISRMFDDLKAHRPVIDYDFDGAQNLLMEIKDWLVSIEDKKKDKRVVKMGEMWLKMIAYMDMWAFCLKQREDNISVKNKVKMRVFDDDGNMIEGVSEEDEKMINILNEMRRVLCGLFIKTDTTDEDNRWLLDRIQSIEVLIKAIFENKVDDLIYLMKCQEAAEEFAEA